jgi:hypothetical protein
MELPTFAEGRLFDWAAVKLSAVLSDACDAMGTATAARPDIAA